MWPPKDYQNVIKTNVVVIMIIMIMIIIVLITITMMIIIMLIILMLIIMMIMMMIIVDLCTFIISSLSSSFTAPVSLHAQGLSVDSLFSGADLAIEVEGSDHAPVWADLALPSPLPAAAVAPPMSARLVLSARTLPLDKFREGVVTLERGKSSSLFLE